VFQGSTVAQYSYDTCLGTPDCYTTVAWKVHPALDPAGTVVAPSTQTCPYDLFDNNWYTTGRCTSGWEVEKIMLKYTVSNVDFTKLTDEMKTSMKAAVTQGVVESLGGHYTSDEIAVVLKAGSVVAEVTVTPKGETATALQAKASGTTMKAALETAVLAKVVAVPNLETALTSGTLADVVATDTTVPSGTDTTGTGTTGTTGDTNGTDSTGDGTGADVVSSANIAGLAASVMATVMVALAMQA